MAVLDRVFVRVYRIAIGLALVNLAELVGVIGLSSDQLAAVNFVGGAVIAAFTSGQQIATRVQQSRAAHPSSAQ